MSRDREDRMWELLDTLLEWDDLIEKFGLKGCLLFVVGVVVLLVVLLVLAQVMQ
jgi:hypothetical protein